MSTSVFDSHDYKQFLRDLGEVRRRGFRKALAEACQCQTAYVSQVLNAEYHFSVEQAEAATRFLEMSKEEARYFVLLVAMQRAGTPALRSFFGDQLKELRERHQQVQTRVKISATLGEEHHDVYYSSWHYSAVHIAITIPRLRTRAALGKALRIPPRKLGEVLEYLCSVSLIEKQGDRYLPGSTQLHLPGGSPHISRHHANWRSQSLALLDSEHVGDDLRYSVVASLSEADAKKVKALLMQSIAETVQVIKESPEERLYSFNVDFFRVDETG